MKPKSGALQHSGLKWERVKVRFSYVGRKIGLIDYSNRYHQ